MTAAVIVISNVKLILVEIKEDKKSITQSTGLSHVITAFRIWRHPKVALGKDSQLNKTIKMYDIRGKRKQVRQFLY